MQLLRATATPTAEEYVAVTRGGGTTFAHLFDTTIRESTRGRTSLATDEAVTPQDVLNDKLATLLNTSIDKLPVDLGQVGQELAFYRWAQRREVVAVHAEDRATERQELGLAVRGLTKTADTVRLALDPANPAGAGSLGRKFPLADRRRIAEL